MRKSADSGWIGAVLGSALLAVAGSAQAQQATVEWPGCGLQPIDAADVRALRPAQLATMGALALDGPFQINIVPGPGLQANPAALQAFQRAAAAWAAVIRDPMTVTIDANLVQNLPSGVLGGTVPRAFAVPRATALNALAAEAARESGDDVARLLPQITTAAAVPSGLTFDPQQVILTKTLLKAIGMDADAAFGPSDGTIEFNANVAFDFDNRDGVAAGQLDFETVATHEIGHLLGFISIVDSVDVDAVNPVQLTGFDLYRFASASPNSPRTTAEFTSLPRNLQPGVESVFDDVPHDLQLSTGELRGDGRQASHWKANELTGITIGVMDPTLDRGEVVRVSAADKRALDLIGYEISAADAAPAVSVVVRPAAGSPGIVLGGSGPMPVVTANTPIEFASTATDGDGLGFPIFARLPNGSTGRVSYVWDFAGVQPVNGPLAVFSPAPVVRFDLPRGAATRTLAVGVDVFDTLGDTTGRDLSVRVSEAPTVAIQGASPLRVAVGAPVQLQGSVSDVDGVGFPIFQSSGNNTPITFVWNFGGGEAPGLSAFAQSPVVRFPRPGTFTVTLTGFDALGLSAAASVSVVVN